MKGDFTRSTFHPEKHYHGVLSQQGRVQLDSDWNEQLGIQRHLDETTSLDVIGACGVPKKGGGFKIGIAPSGQDLTISAGRIYVDGILCDLEGSTVALLKVATDQCQVTHILLDGVELTEGTWIEILDAAKPTTSQIVRITAVDDLTISFQPSLTIMNELEQPEAVPVLRRVVSYLRQEDLPGAPAISDLADGDYLAYLDVWLRHVTVLDDPGILERALGGPDTTTRSKVIAQVKVAKLDQPGYECSNAPRPAALQSDSNLRQTTTGRMAARGHPPEDPTDICDIPPDARYQGLENQLYRIEVHEPGELGEASFKWSRENGSVVVAWEGQLGVNGSRLTVSSTGRDPVLGFASGQLVELSDDTVELAGLPGTIVSLSEPPQENTLIIDPGSGVDFADFPIRPKVRRWDCSAIEKVSRPAANEGFLRLENGVEVTFEDGYYNTGDYWLIPARTENRKVEWPQDGSGNAVPTPPAGIAHHYCTLAILTLEDGVFTAVKDCRDPFPSLTEMCAEDVCFRNDQCQIPGAGTVQEALDALCEESTLRRHKKHLHGWGIVCGLELACLRGDEEGRSVTVKGGYAIDCEGNDLIQDESFPLDVFKMVETTDPDLIKDGEGDVCLTMRGDPDQGIVWAIEAHDPHWDQPHSHLDGTLMMDIYNDCIKKIEDFIRSEVESNGSPDGAGPAAQRASVLATLLAQVFEPSKQIYISEREHKIMLDFYQRLRALLQSETFCAMFDGAHPFPEYPASMPAMDTIFGLGHHERIRLRPNSNEAYTVGGGLKPIKPGSFINRYDLDDRVLVERLDPVAGTTSEERKSSAGIGAIDDVAFSQNGKRIFMVAPTRNRQNTLFRAGTIGERGVEWDSLVTICGVRIVTLATTAADPAHIYGAGIGSGIYQFDPDNIDPSMSPKFQFNAVGHLVITPDGNGYATCGKEGAELDAGEYNQLAAFDVKSQVSSSAFFDLELEGRDDLTVMDGPGGRDDVFVGLGSGKRIVARYTTVGGRVSTAETEISSSLSLAVHQPEKAVLLLGEDEFVLDMMEESGGTNSYRLPVQVAPSSLAVAEKHGVVLNYWSNTVTYIPRENLARDYTFPHRDLATYRGNVVTAFRDLMAGFLQYLKDCICDHLLVKCPQCDEDDKIFLGCISIRKNQVWRVCNFSRRRYVKSFPTIGYWMSAIPVFPILDMLVEKFCCIVLPDLFGKYEFDTTSEGLHVPWSSARKGIATSQEFDVASKLNEFKRRLPVAWSVLVRGAAARMAAPKAKAVPISGSIEKEVEEASRSLTEKGVNVTTRPMAQASFSELIGDVVRFFRTPRAGDHVVLQSEKNIVKFGSVSRRPKATGVAVAGAEEGGQIEALRQQLSGMEAELSELRQFREEVLRRLPPEK